MNLKEIFVNKMLVIFVKLYLKYLFCKFFREFFCWFKKCDIVSLFIKWCFMSKFFKVW